MLLFNLRDPLTIVIFFVVIIFAFAYHEFAHAYVADKLGDPTPRKHGRITLNPLPHLSLVGLVMLALVGFGGAYTPITPSLLRGDRRRSEALVAVAGPIANLLMAAVFGLLSRLLLGGFLPYPDGFIGDVISQLMYWGLYLNVFLAIFNLVPIPPLDGFTILMGILPRNLADQIAPLRQYGMVALMLVLFVLPTVGIDVFGKMIRPTIQFLLQLIGGW